MAVVGQTTINEKQVTYKRDDYGTWVCVQNYEHYGGENPSVAPGDTFPQLPNGLSTDADVEALGASGELRHVDDIDQYGSWNVDAVRLEGYTANHDRVIDFFTTNQTVIDAVLTEQSAETNYTDYQGDTTTLTDAHSANLPAAAGDGNADTRSDRIFGAGFPFYNGGTYHWAVAGAGNRWEVDDYADGAQYSTVHRVWVRVPDLAVDTAGVSVPADTTESIALSHIPDGSGFTADATVDSANDSDTVTVEFEPIKRSVRATGSRGDAVVSRTTTAARAATAASAGAATAVRSLTGSRDVHGAGERGAATVTRSAAASRDVTGGGAGDATVARSATNSRGTLGEGSGDATPMRALTAGRNLLATGDRGNATVLRTATISRDVTAAGTGAATVLWSAPRSWTLPTSPKSGRRLLLTPEAVETDHDQLSLTGQVTSPLLDDLAHYRSAGDVDRQATAFGAYRRVRRDGSDPVTIHPPGEQTPPFDERDVVPTDWSAEEIAPRRHEVSLTLGLEEPRPREPLEGDGATIRADSLTATVDAGATETVTLSWTPDGSQLGDWLATVEGATDSDSQLVTVSNAPWTIAFPVATLSLTRTRVGQVSRSQASSVPSFALPVKLDVQQAAVLLAVGSRVEAVETRTVPDAGNTVVDTLPDSELTAGLSTPVESDVDDGTAVLAGWSLTQSRPAPPRFDATLEFVRTD